MKVQQVAFNGKRIGSKRWTTADIRHGIEALGSNPRPGNVNPILGRQFLITRQIDRGDGVFRTIPAPPSRRPQNAKRTRQQMSRATHPSFTDQVSDVTAGNRLAAKSLLWVNLHLKSHLRPELP